MTEEFLTWLRAQRLRKDSTGDIARLCERGRCYQFAELQAAVDRAARRYPLAHDALARAINEFELSRQRT
jgi:hypothetical protein